MFYSYYKLIKIVYLISWSSSKRKTMRYIFLLTIFCLISSNLLAQNHQLDIFNEESESLEEGVQFHSFSLLHNNTALVSLYAERDLYIFDGQHFNIVHSFDTTEGPIWSISQEINNTCLISLDKNRVYSLYKYDTVKKTFQKIVSGQAGTFSYDLIRSQLYIYQGDTLFKKEDEQLIPVLSNSRNIGIEDGKIYFIPKQQDYFGCRLSTGEVKKYPLPPTLAERTHSDNIYWVRNQNNVYQLDMNKPEAKWENIYKTNNNLEGKLAYNKRTKELIFFETFKNTINQYQVTVLNPHTKTSKKYTYRHTEALISRQQLLQDSLGKIWILTQSSLLRLNPYSTILEPALDNYPGNTWALATQANGQTLMAAYQVNQPLAIYDNGKIRLDRDYISAIRKAINNPLAKVRPFVDVKPYKDRLILMSDMPTGIVEYSTEIGFIKFHPFKNGMSFFTAHQSKKTKKWYFGNAHSQIFKTTTSTIGEGYDTLSISKDERLNVLALHEDSYERLWAGSKGLYLFNPESKKPDATFLKNYAIYAVTTDYKNNLWAAVGVKRKTSKVAFVSIPKDGLPKEEDFQFFDFPKIQPLGIVQDTFLVIGGNGRLGILHLSDFYDKGKFEPRYLMTNDGYPLTITERYSFNIDKEGFFWAADTRGYIIRLNLTEAWRTAVGALEAPTPVFLKVKFDDNEYDLDGIDFIEVSNTSDRNLEFTLSRINNIGYFSNISYAYEIKKNGQLIKKDILPNKKNKWIVSGLEGGRYELFVTTVLPNGVKSDAIKIPLILKMRFSEKYGTTLTVLAILFALVAAIVLYFYRKKQVAFKRQNKEWFIAMFNGQMNIHFLGNAFAMASAVIEQGAVQLYEKIIFKLGQSVKTLSTSSELKKVYHTLEEELVLVESNLWIYQKKYPSSLKEYHLPDKTQITDLLKINVPLQSILVHTDNAVEHGLMWIQESGVGEIWVKISDDKDFLIVKITDNGVGREKSKAINKHQEKQVGKKNNGIAENLQKQLTDRFNKINKLQIKRTHTFLDEKNRIGNITTIKIPKTYQYEY